MFEQPIDSHIMAFLIHWHPQPVKVKAIHAMLNPAFDKRAQAIFDSLMYRLDAYTWEDEDEVGLTDKAVKEFSYWMEE